MDIETIRQLLVFHRDDFAEEELRIQHGFNADEARLLLAIVKIKMNRIQREYERTDEYMEG